MTIPRWFRASMAAVAVASLSLTLFAQVTETAPVPSTVTVHVDAAKTADYRIPRTIFGSFLEPIGNST
ncbi:hypothetical protein, partial [Silvibacterium sp.]|uniref:hypothetical protein n=1 Tax=Silvibacterium sp. TaxID=1964179 RepID=UPI0039E4716D